RSQFVPYLLQQRLHTRRFDGLERHPVQTWSAVIVLSHPIGFAKGLHLANMDKEAPEAPSRFSLRLGVYPPSQVLQTDGRLYHLAPAFHIERGVAGSRVPWLHGRYPASSLLRTPPPPSCLQPTSRGVTGYTTYLAPPISRRDTEGFSSCVT